MSFAEQFLRKEKVADNTEAVIQLLEIMTSNESKIQLTPEQTESIKSLKTKCSFQVKPLVEIYREKLWKQWRQYADPEMNLKTAVSLHESNKRRESEAREKAIKEKDGVNVAQFVTPRDFHETIIEIENAQYLIDPKTGLAAEKPLQYSKKVEWEDFCDKVHLNPYSGTVDLYKTLIDIMKECTRVGCTRDQLCLVYKLFIFHHMKESYNSLSYEQDAETIFDILMGLLDVNSHLARMKECLRMIKRRPHEGVTTPIRAYQSLIAEVLSVQSPNSTEKENREQAAKEAAKAVKFFTTKAVWAELQKYKEQFKNKHHRFVSLSEIIEFVNEYETIPGMRPSSTITLDNQDVKIDLFFSDTQQSWSCQFGQNHEDLVSESEEEYDDRDDEEVHTSELSDMGPRYANLPSTLGSHYDNAASTVAAHDRAKTRSQPGPLHPGVARWDAQGHLSPVKRKSMKTKAKSAVPGRPSSGGSRGFGSQTSDRKSRPPQRGTSYSGPPGIRSPSSTATSPSRAQTSPPGQPPRPASPYKARSGSASSSGSNYRKGKSPEKSSSRERGRSPSVGRCWICWKRHPDGRCEYGKIKATQNMCKCNQGYHPKSLCRTPHPSVDLSKKGSDHQTFMPRVDSNHPN